MKKSIPAALLSLLSLVAITGSASGAIVISSWTYETLTTTDSLAPNAGAGEATVSTFDMGNGSAAQSLGGVSFSVGAAGAFRTSGPITMAYSIPQVAWASSFSGAYTANSVLNTFDLTNPSNNGALEFSGLTSGQAYTFQFIVADSRSGGPDGRKVQIFGATVSGSTVTLTGEASSQLRYAYQGQEQYGVISATFTADSTGKAAFLPRIFAADGTTAQGTQMNAIHIMTVPEPSVALLGGFGMLGLLRRRRIA